MRLPVSLVILLLAVLVSLPGCRDARTVAPDGDGTVTIQGELTYPERIALPPQAVAVIEVRAFDATGEQILIEQRLDLEGRQVPIPFRLELPSAALGGTAIHELRGAVELEGQWLRVTEPLMLSLTGNTLDTGPLRLIPFTAARFGTHFTCGPEQVVLDASPRLIVSGTAHDLVPVPAASGVRLEGVEDPDTWIHEKGGEALISVAGRELPPCRITPPPSLPFRAYGQEPGWHVDIEQDRITLVTGYGAQTLTLPLLHTGQDGPRTRFRAADAGHRLVVAVAPDICRDSMSGMPHPYTVILQWDDETLNGCGGEPLSLLTDREWVIEDLDGQGIVDQSRITLQFFAQDGRVAGTASCNRYHGGFRLTGENLTFQHPASTLMACPEALMHQEQTFFRILAAVTGFDIDATGALVLSGPEGTMKGHAEPMASP